MDAVRYLYADDWLAARSLFGSDDPVAPQLHNMVLDTLTNISPWTHPALVVNLGIDHLWHVCGARTLGLYGTDPTYSGMALGELPYGVPTISQLNLQGAESVAWEPVFGLFAYTTQAGDALQFTTNAQQVTVRFAGYTAAGQGLESGDGVYAASIRNGALASIMVGTGAPTDPVLELINTWHHNPVANVYLLDGNAHTITIANTGRHDPAFHPVSRIKPLYSVPIVGQPHRVNSMQATLQVTPLASASFERWSWRAVAVTTTTWALYQTPPDGVEALVPGAGALPVATHFTDLVPGTNVFVTQAEPLVPGDSVTFSTDVLQMAIQYIEFGWGEELGPCRYVSAPVFCGGDDTQYFLAEWFENEQWGSFSLEAGDIDSDGTVRWQPAYTVACNHQALDIDTDLPGTAIGDAGLMGGPRGQYMRWTLTAPDVAAALPYMRDLSFYYWPPERDLTMVTKMPLGEDIVLGPVLNALIGTLETFLCQTHFETGRYIAGATVHSATDEYLAWYGEDVGLSQYFGEPPQSYRRRLAAAFSSGQNGGSMPFIASRVAELIFGAVRDPVLAGPPDPIALDPVTNAQEVVAWCAEANPLREVTRQVQVVRDSTLPLQSYQVLMPPMSSDWPYQGLPQVAPAQIKSIVENYLLDILNPVAAVIDYHHVSWHVVWPPGM